MKIKQILLYSFKFESLKITTHTNALVVKFGKGNILKIVSHKQAKLDQELGST